MRALREPGDVQYLYNKCGPSFFLFPSMIPLGGACLYLGANLIFMLCYVRLSMCLELKLVGLSFCFVV